MANQCPLINWFRFEKKCTIKRCKYNSKILNTGCIAIERSNHQRKELTDAEILYYKFSNSVAISKVLAHKKSVALRVKHILILHKYIQYVSDLGCDRVDLDQKYAFLLDTFPLRLKRLNVTPCILAHMLNEKHYIEFCAKNGIDCDVKLHSLFMLNKTMKDLLTNEDK